MRQAEILGDPREDAYVVVYRCHVALLEQVDDAKEAVDQGELRLSERAGGVA